MCEDGYVGFFFARVVQLASLSANLCMALDSWVIMLLAFEGCVHALMWVSDGNGGD